MNTKVRAKHHKCKKNTHKFYKVQETHLSYIKILNGKVFLLLFQNIDNQNKAFTFHQKKRSNFTNSAHHQMKNAKNAWCFIEISRRKS